MSQEPNTTVVVALAASRSIARLRSSERARQQVAQVDRLGDVVVARDFQPENAIDLGVAARHEDDPGLAERLDFLGELETVTVGKLYVEEDQVGAPALERLAALGAAAGFRHVVVMV